MKTCTKCKEEYPATTEYYHLGKNGEYGLRSWCKLCTRKKSQSYYQENKDDYAKRGRLRRELAKPEMLKRRKEKRDSSNEKRGERRRAYYNANRDKNLAARKVYREKNKGEIAVYSQEYREKNKKKVLMHKRLYASRRRARVRTLPATFTSQEWLDCLEYFNYSCAVCGNQLRDLFGDTVPHADHWIPLSSEECTGTIATNMICLCNHCNLSKSAIMPNVWLARHYTTKQTQQILDRIEAYFKVIKLTLDNG